MNSAKLVTPVAELDTFAAAMVANPQVAKVLITGHTDQLGKAAHNRILSQQRADAVKAYLVSKGVAENRLSAKGMASTQLLKQCDLSVRAAAIECGTPNRRVEVEPITVPSEVALRASNRRQSLAHCFLSHAEPVRESRTGFVLGDEE